jgi:SAM-dependent methyltransferase
MKVLNVGCGNSRYGTHFIDLYPQRDDVIKCDIEKQKIPFPDGFFDEVYSENIFEHMKNPNAALLKMLRVLKRGGKITVITDNASFWGWHTPISKTHYGGYERNMDYGEDDRHFALYTTWHLENHLKDLGIKNIKIEYIMKDDKNPYLFVRAVSNFLGLFYKRVAFPQVMAIGVKP